MSYHGIKQYIRNKNAIKKKNNNKEGKEELWTQSGDHSLLRKKVNYRQLVYENYGFKCQFDHPYEGPRFKDTAIIRQINLNKSKTRARNRDRDEKLN